MSDLYIVTGAVFFHLVILPFVPHFPLCASPDVTSPLSPWSTLNLVCSMPCAVTAVLYLILLFNEWHFGSKSVNLIS